MWQDWVLMIGGFGFFIGLLPSLIGKHKPEQSSSIITGSILLIFGVVYATLGLWLAFASTLLTSITWFILAIQVSRKIYESRRQSVPSISRSWRENG